MLTTAAAFLTLAAATARPARCQSMLERTPNLEGTWTLPRWSPVFVFAHRFELISGGDEMLNVPTLTLAVGLPLGLTAGLDYSSNSEIVPAGLGGNETEYWLKRAFTLGGEASVALIAAYNSAAESVDGAVTARTDVGRITVLAEGRAFSDRFGSGDGGLAGAAGAVVRFTPYLAAVSDFAVTDAEGVDTPWSAGLALAIPGTPHTLALYATNTGATTLQGISRSKVIGPEAVRYGFTFTIPLGSGRQWAQIVRADPAAAGPTSAAGDTVRIDIVNIAYAVQEVRIRPGQVVEWINRDPTVHTVTADDGTWGSELLQQGQRYARRFDAPGRHPYHCIPHPQMQATVVVEE